MQQRVVKLLLILLFATIGLYSQNTEIDRLIDNELKMTFPSIYFKHNSSDYAAMPYTTDSCFKYIATHIKDINDLVIWRDSSEKEALTTKRIKKLKAGLNKYTPSKEINIQSMGKEQKISQHTVYNGTDSSQIQYLLALNSVFEIAKTRLTITKGKKNHLEHPRIYCWSCWKSGFHMDKSSREYRKMLRAKKKASKDK